MKTLQDLAQDALTVQNACNLTGVAHSFSRAVSDLRELFPNEGTEFFNTHPIVVLWVNKLASLSGAETVHAFSRAYAEVSAMARQYHDTSISVVVEKDVSERFPEAAHYVDYLATFLSNRFRGATVSVRMGSITSVNVCMLDELARDRLTREVQEIASHVAWDLFASEGYKQYIET